MTHDPAAVLVDCPISNAGKSSGAAVALPDVDLSQHNLKPVKFSSSPPSTLDKAAMSVHADPPPAIVTEPHGINYATSNQLGKGGFAICFKAERLEGSKPSGHLVALKIVKTKMEPAKLAQKARSCHRRKFAIALADSIPVHYGITDPLQAVASEHCRVSSRIFLYRKHLCCP